MNHESGAKGPQHHHNTVCLAVVLFVLAGGGGAEMESLVPAAGAPTCVAHELAST